MAVNKTDRVNNDSTALEDPPVAKKTRICHKKDVKKETTAGGRALNNRAGDEQGELVLGQGEFGPSKGGPWANQSPFLSLRECPLRL